jgi:hypothetical protein
VTTIGLNWNKRGPTRWFCIKKVNTVKLTQNRVVNGQHISCTSAPLVDWGNIDSWKSLVPPPWYWLLIEATTDIKSTFFYFLWNGRVAHYNVKKEEKIQIKRGTKIKTERTACLILYATEVMLLLIISKSIFRKRSFLQIILMECPDYV